MIQPSKPVRQIAESVGVHEMTLGRWVKNARDAQEASGQTPLTTDERAELKQLRAENADLKMQVEFLKK